MLKFFINLFKKKKKPEMEIEVDREAGVMTIKTNRKLSTEEIKELIRKHVLGENDGDL